MSRSKGIASFSANFEPQIGAPLDGRLVVSTLADLTTASTWFANDGLPYAYIGMIVSVTNDGINNGIYRLNASDYTNASNWVAAGSGGGDGGGTVGFYDGGHAATTYTATQFIEAGGA